MKHEPYNYRIVESGGDYFVHTVYYGTEGNIEAISKDPASPWGADVDSLHIDFDLMLKGLFKPVLHMSDLTGKAR